MLSVFWDAVDDRPIASAVVVDRRDEDLRDGHSPENQGRYHRSGRRSASMKFDDVGVILVSPTDRCESTISRLGLVSAADATDGRSWPIVRRRDDDEGRGRARRDRTVGMSSVGGRWPRQHTRLLPSIRVPPRMRRDPSKGASRRVVPGGDPPAARRGSSFPASSIQTPTSRVPRIVRPSWGTKTEIGLDSPCRGRRGVRIDATPRSGPIVNIVPRFRPVPRGRARTASTISSPDIPATSSTSVSSPEFSSRLISNGSGPSQRRFVTRNANDSPACPHPPGNPSIVRLPRRGAEVVGEGGWIGDDGRKDDSRGGGSFSRPIPTRYGNLWMSRWPVSQDGRDRDDVP